LTAKDKAKELVEKYLFNGDMIDDIRMSEESAIESALICVDEILESLWNVGHSSSNDEIKYWQEVKQEINKL
jgi:hypothetical protein|tara:strand:+ start:47 stop:262 length:216 start_codon:yes stop_codon:yes gene_type:complete